MCSDKLSIKLRFDGNILGLDPWSDSEDIRAICYYVAIEFSLGLNRASRIAGSIGNPV
jgi:hypothetical protein